jgi:hypothetical protein
MSPTKRRKTKRINCYVLSYFPCATVWCLSTIKGINSRMRTNIRPTEHRAFGSRSSKLTGSLFLYAWEQRFADCLLHRLG